MRSSAAAARTLVDANVIIDVATRHSEWLEWSSAALAEEGNAGVLAINPIILAELAPSFETPEELDRGVPVADFARLPLPWEAAHLAGHRFVRYRRAGGRQRSPLPDFYIGAHAQVEGLRLLTRDATRYRTYFPELDIVAPEG